MLEERLESVEDKKKILKKKSTEKKTRIKKTKSIVN